MFTSWKYCRLEIASKFHLQVSILLLKIRIYNPIIESNQDNPELRTFKQEKNIFIKLLPETNKTTIK